MMESMVDYVLERGNQHYGQFSQRGQADTKSTLFNHRKLLQYLFQDNETSHRIENQKRISDLKYQQISGQLNYFSEKLHGELNKKHLDLDSDMYKLQNQWLRKKIPDFYSYYFLKFAYANTYSRMHQLFLSELQHMSREKDSYLIIKRTIEGRQVCLANLRKQINALTELDVEQSMQTLRNQQKLKRKKIIQNQQRGYEKKKKTNKGKGNEDDDDNEVGKSWKNKLELIFQSISHLRKLTCYTVQLIKNWKNSIYSISQDPRRFRERVIFFHNDANYLIKIIFDNKFVSESFLKKYLNFASHYDPFLLRPSMMLENKKPKISEDQQIFLNLIQPTQQQMTKMTKSLVILAEQQYDQDEQSRFLTQRKNHGELEHRKKLIERRRDMFAAKSTSNLNHKPQDKNNKQPDSAFKNDKKSELTKNQIQQNQMQKAQKMSKSRIQSSLNRVKKMRSVDLKKVSPYLSRNQRIAKAQKVIQLEHKFRVAQNQYVDSVNKKKQTQTKEHQPRKKQELKKQWASSHQEIANNKIFNKYIEENLKIMQQANKKAFIYKNKVSPKKTQSIAKEMNYNRISFRERKQAQYEKNLEQYQRDERVLPHSQSNSRSKLFSRSEQKGGDPQNPNRGKTIGTKQIIQISDKGIRSNKNIIDYQLSGRKGKNVGKILDNNQKQQQMRMIQQKLNPSTFQNKSRLNIRSGNNSMQQQQNYQTGATNTDPNNLYQSQQRPQIIIMRQQPEKIQEIKQFLYAKIKQQLLEQMKKNNQNKQHEINSLIEAEKRKKLEQIIQQRKAQQLKKKQEAQRMRLAQLQKERKKIDFDVRIQAVQYSQQNVGEYFQGIFGITPQAYHRMYLNQKIQEKKEQFMDEFYLLFLKGYVQYDAIGYSIARYDWRCETSRKIVLQYVAVHNFVHFISYFHQVCQYLWKNDPVQHIQIVVYNNLQNVEGAKIIEDLQQYADRRGQTYQKTLYSNIIQMKYIWSRPKQYHNIDFQYKGYYFGKKMNLKCQLLSSAFNMNQRISPIIDMNLEIYTSYVFLLQQLFRKYLTPEQVIQLRQSSTNIRRLKDIFRIVLQLEKTNPIVDELTIVEGLNLDDLYEKLQDKLSPPYTKYYWEHFYDRTLQNRILLAILKFTLELEFPINSAILDDRRYFRVNPRRKVLVLKSSVYSRDNIYILNTDNKKIRMFIMDAEHYKLMRIQLFIFLNLVFNNIVQDRQLYVNSFWVPQLVVNNAKKAEEKTGKQVKRITDFSISMKKSFFLSEQIYYANHQYIKNALSFLPRKSDVIYKQAVIIGFLHTAVQNGSTGMPLYAKMIDRGETFDS